MKYILWGVGKCAGLIWQDIKSDVIRIVDGNAELWGKEWNGYVIESPDILSLETTKYEKIIIASVEWRKIRSLIKNKYNINDKYIDNMNFLKRENMLSKYVNTQIDIEEKKYVNYIKNNPLDVFNHEFADKYIDYSDIEVEYNAQIGLYYVYHCGKKMYFNRRFQNKQCCARYYNGLRMEQDIQSPHRYRVKDFDVEDGDIVLDAGVAEGNFALEIIDRVEKLYLIESDELWIEALRYTFEEYKDKVEIVHALLGDGNDGTVSLDEIIAEGDIDFIKMDVEGAEISVLKGADRVLREKKPKILSCTYHNPDDYLNIKGILENYSYETEHSNGYMCFLTLDNYKNIEMPVLVRGLIKGR